MNFTKLALIEKGKKSYTCRICDYVKYASFPATGHSFVDGVCSGCGFEAPDHDYVGGICIDCGRPLPEDVQPPITSIDASHRLQHPLPLL